MSQGRHISQSKNRIHTGVLYCGVYTLPAGTLTFPRVCGQTPGFREIPGYSLNLPAEVKLIEFLCMLNNPGGYPISFFVPFRSIDMVC